MDYEKKYKEALEKLRYKISDNNGNIDYKEIVTAEELQDIFPELTESDDERIRKSIICGMNALKDQKKETFAAVPIDDCIAWLEKQVLKPKWAKEDKINVEDIMYFIDTQQKVIMQAKRLLMSVLNG